MGKRVIERWIALEWTDCIHVTLKKIGETSKLRNFLTSRITNYCSLPLVLLSIKLIFRKEMGGEKIMSLKFCRVGC